MNRIFNYKINKEYNNLKLHDFLSLKGYSAAILTKLRQDDSLSLINGKASYLNTILKENDLVSINLIEEHFSEKIPAVKLDFKIIYEDEDLIVINKTSNMPIHPSLNNYENSLANALCYYYSKEQSPFVFRCVNRLDKDTSGLTIIAKNALSGSILSNEKNRHLIKRSYFAIVSNEDPINEQGTINKPIGRIPGSTIERYIDYENGESAITHYNLLDKTCFNGKNLALIKCNLETGRTHQIRVHMKSIGHPLIGDFLYNPNDHTMNRQALHAGVLSFVHPIKKELLTFKAALPDDMKKFFKNYIQL